MEMKPNGDISGKRTGDAHEQGENSAKRLKCSIESKAFCCNVCNKRLGPPIFQCPEGHLFCSSCHDKLPEEKCTFSSGCTGTVSSRNHAMERAVQSILINCCHAKLGCTEETTYSDSYKHELLCLHGQCKCPEAGCGFTGRAAELLDHLTAGHQWPSTMFQYWVPFDLYIVEPGTHVLHCKNDGQLFLLSVQQAAEPTGLTVSLVSVQYGTPSPIGCSVSFSCSRSHHNTSTLDDLWPWWRSTWPPTEYICFVPKVSGEPDNDGIMLTINITSVDAADENDDPEDKSYAVSDEGGDDSYSSYAESGEDGDDSYSTFVDCNEDADDGCSS